MTSWIIPLPFGLLYKVEKFEYLEDEKSFLDETSNNEHDWTPVKYNVI